MPTNMRRMTIVVPDEVEEQRDILKKEFYYAVSRSEMVRDLIGIGIKEKLRELNPGDPRVSGKAGGAGNGSAASKG